MREHNKNFWHSWVIPVVVVAIFIAIFTNNGKYAEPGIYGHLAIPGRFLIANLSPFIGGYGMAIILLTVIVRLCLMPAMINQTKHMTQNRIAMKAFQPKLKELRHKIQTNYRNGNVVEYKKYEHQMVSLYKTHKLGLGNMGCGTLLAQLPVFAGLYAAIRFSPEVKQATFLNVPLGKPSLAVAGVCFALYFINALITKYNVKKNGDTPGQSDGKTELISNGIIFMMPFWIGFISMSVSAGLALYFCVGGLFVIGQQLYIIQKTPEYKAEGQRLLRQTQAKGSAPN